MHSLFEESQKKPSSIDLMNTLHEEAATRNRSHSSHSPIQKGQKGGKTGLNYTSLYSTPSAIDSIRNLQGAGHRRFASQLSESRDLLPDIRVRNS